MRYLHYLLGVALLALVAVVGLRLTDWRPFRSTHTVDHAEAVTEVLAQRALCGAEVALAWDLTTTSGLEPLPDVLVGREARGTVYAHALACSLGVPRVTADDEGVTIVLPAPSVAYAWVDVEATDLPAQSRGLWDRLADGVTCLIGDCDTYAEAADAWLDEAATRVYRLAAETTALTTARAEVAGLVGDLTAKYHPTITFEEEPRANQS